MIRRIVLCLMLVVFLVAVPDFQSVARHPFLVRAAEHVDINTASADQLRSINESLKPRKFQIRGSVECS